MRITYTSVRDPRWVARDTIDCWVKFDHIDKEVPFTASPKDVEEHGRDIFLRAVSGEFGTVEVVPRVQSEHPILLLPPEIADLQRLLDDVNAENARGTERGLVLVWTSILDEILRRALASFFVDSHRDVDALLGTNGPAGTFSGRTKLAYLLGLIARDEMQAIDQLRKIRNDFAHRIGVSLEDPPMRAKCEQLYEKVVGDGIRLDARLKFSGVCGRLFSLLLSRAALASQMQRTEMTFEEELPHRK